MKSLSDECTQSTYTHTSTFACIKTTKSPRKKQKQKLSKAACIKKMMEDIPWIWSTQNKRESNGETDRERQRLRQTDGKTERDRQTDRQRLRERERGTDTQTNYMDSPRKVKKQQQLNCLKDNIHIAEEHFTKIELIQLCLQKTVSHISCIFTTK